MKTTIKYYTTFALLLGIVQSCKVTKDYARPGLQLPVAYDNVGENFKRAEIPAYAHFFKDRQLITLIDQVMSKNPDLLVASEDMLAAEAQLKSVKLNYLPDISLQVNTGIQRLSKNSMQASFGGGVLFQEYNFAPVVSWDIDFWGRLKKQREESLANYLSKAENRRALRVQLVAQTAQAYYNLLSLDEQLKITGQVEKSMQETVAMLKTQYSVGDVTTLAIKQAEAQLAETRALIPEIKASVKAQEHALQSLAGRYPDVVNRAGQFSSDAFAGDLETGVPADLLANRPDVKQQELLLQAASARVGVAKTDFYPSLKITGQGGSNATNLANWFSVPGSLFGTAAAGLTQPIFNRRNVRSTYEQALRQRDAAVHTFRKAVVTAVEEVSTAMNNMVQVRQQLTEVSHRKNAMDKAIADALLLYKYGEATYLEVLTVQQSSFRAELAHTAVRQKEINTYLALYKSLGGN